MTQHDPPDPTQQTGLAGAYLAHRERLLRFLNARGAGDAAEDILHDVWLRISAAKTGPVAAPLAYLYRTANLVMIDRYRSTRQARQRDRDWSEASHAGEPDPHAAPYAERKLVAHQYAQLVGQTLAGLGERPHAIFRRHRIDGIPQRQLADEFGVSLSTVESDLRTAYRALAGLREQFDEA